MSTHKTKRSNKMKVEPLLKSQSKHRNLMTKPFGVNVLGIPLNLAMYLNNGFRFVGTAANVELDKLDLQKQRLRNHVKLNPAAPGPTCIKTGYDAELTITGQDALSCVTQLRNPRHRLVNELFWPHVSEEVFNDIATDKHIQSTSAVAKLKKIEVEANGQEKALALHALAVIYHNKAIMGELSYKAHRHNWPRDDWALALEYWSKTLTNKHFWNYLKNRITALSDPRLQVHELDTIRAGLPKGILSFNGFFVRLHVLDSKPEAYGMHFDVLNSSDIKQSAKREAQIEVVRSIVTERLNPLVRWAENPESYRASLQASSQGKRKVRCNKCGGRLREVREKDTVGKDRLCPRCDIEANQCPFCERKFKGATTPQDCSHCGRSWHKCVSDGSKLRKQSLKDSHYPRSIFSEIYEPLLQEVEHLLRFLKGRLGLPDDLIQTTQFDTFCATIQKAVDNKLLYEAEDHPRAVFYALSVTKRLLCLPMSQGQKMNMEQEFKNTRKNLYGEFHVPNNLDPTQCFFLADEPADPDESIVLDMHKITKVRGCRVEWAKRRILVPRSNLAAQVHKGTLSQSRLNKILEDNRFDLESKKKAMGKKGKTKTESLQKRYSANIADCRKRYQEALLGTGSFGGLLLITLPITLLAIGVSTATAIGSLKIGVVSPDTVLPIMTWLQGHISNPEISSLITPTSLMGAIGVLLGFVVGLVTGNYFRKGNVRKAHRALKATKTELKIETDKIREDANKKMRDLKKRLKAGFAVKQESSKSQYPVYKSAKQKGYKDGEDPSKSQISEINQREFDKFLNSLSNDEKYALSLVSNSIGEKQSGEFIDNLMMMSSSERKKALKKIAPLGSLGPYGRGFGSYY